MQSPEPGIFVDSKFEHDKSFTRNNVLAARDLVREARHHIAKSRLLVARGQQSREKLQQALARNRHLSIPRPS